MAKNSLLQRVIHRLATSDADLDSEEMQRAVEAEAAVPIRTCEDRQQVRLRGTVSNVTIHPRGGHPALEVELRDGSGAARTAGAMSRAGGAARHTRAAASVTGARISRSCAQEIAWSRTPSSSNSDGSCPEGVR